MNLGDSFSLEDKKRFLSDNLKIGSVFYLFCKFTSRHKDKYLVIICETSLLAFIINSKIPKLIQIEPDLLDTQVLLKASSYQFLAHDSYLNCNEVVTLPIEEIEQQVLQDLGRIKGHLALDTLQEIKTAVTLADGLTNREKTTILTALDLKLSSKNK